MAEDAVAPTPTKWQGPLDLAERVIAAEELEDHPLGLTPGSVRQLAIEAYNASLLSEEGRAVRFQICLLQKDNLPGRARVEFLKDEPLTAETLRRLAPAVPRSPYGFLACDVDGDIRLLGWTRLEKRRFRASGELIAPRVEGGLWLRVAGPGLLEVWSSHFRPDTRLLRLASGRIQVSDMDLAAALRSLDLLRAPTSFLLSIVPQALSSAHGLTMAIVPCEGDPLAHATGGRACDAPALGTDVNALLRSAPDARDFNLQRVLDTVRCISRATAIDGAVILDDTLRLLAFGVELCAPDAEVTLLSSSGQPLPTTAMRRGMRHLSAIRYCAHTPGSKVIVASQDGEIRFLRHRAPGQVSVEGPIVDPVPHVLEGTFD